MRRFILAALVGLAFMPGIGRAQSVSTDPKQAPAGSYRIDARHVQVLFAISHLGLTDFHGRFDKVSGTLSFNAADPTKSAAAITIDMTSLDTPNSTLNTELQDAPVFDTAHYATATFKSTSAVRTGTNSGRIAGDLTLKGVTKPVTLDVVFNGGRKSPLGDGAYLLGFHATTTISRADFNLAGMTWSAFVGPDVNLTIEAPFEQAKE